MSDVINFSRCQFQPVFYDIKLIIIVYYGSTENRNLARITLIQLIFSNKHIWISSNSFRDEIQNSAVTQR